MSVDDRMLAVIQALYDAALDETLWVRALQNLTEFTGSQAATFWTLDSFEQPRLPVLTIYNFDLEFMHAYLNGMVPQDPTVQYLVRHPNEPIVHDGVVITEREKDRHPYYDWHGRHSETRYRIVGQTQVSPEVQAGVALHRVGKAGRYEAGDVERFAYVHGHLQRALAIAFRLGSVTALQQSSSEVLDRDPAAILFLDEGRRIVYANRGAEALRSGSDGISLSSAGIVLARKQDQDQLQRLIAGVLSVVRSPGTSGGVMRAARPSGKRPYAILVAPFPQQYPALTAVRPAVCIVISDPEAKRLLPEQRLQAAFGLTAAEAKLASLLAAGENLRSAAKTLGITYGTARARLSEIFVKTDTRRQAELVRLLLATSAMA